MTRERKMSERLFEKVCTIYSKSTTIDADVVRSLSKGPQPDVHGSGSDWTKIEFRGGRTSLTLHRTPYLGPGFSPPNGEFNKAVMGAQDYFRTVKTKHMAAQAALVFAITKVKTLISNSFVGPVNPNSEVPMDSAYYPLAPR